MELLTVPVLSPGVTHLGRLIQEWVGEHEDTVEAYAARCDIPPTTLRGWMSGTKIPMPRKHLERIARGGIPLGLLVRAALTDAEYDEYASLRIHERITTPTGQAVIAALEELTPEEQARVWRMLEQPLELIKAARRGMTDESLRAAAKRHLEESERPSAQAAKLPSSKRTRGE